MKVRKKTLLLLAGIVWSVAGINILRIGLISYSGYVTLVHLGISAVVFGVFWTMVFGKLVRKHTLRITSYEEEFQFFMKFFDVKAFCIMAVMMTAGISLRVFHLWPDLYIAVFYTGLGAALLLAGLLFSINYMTEIKRKKELREERQDAGNYGDII